MNNEDIPPCGNIEAKTDHEVCVQHQKLMQSNTTSRRNDDQLASGLNKRHECATSEADTWG